MTLQNVPANVLPLLKYARYSASSLGAWVAYIAMLLRIVADLTADVLYILDARDVQLKAWRGVISTEPMYPAAILRHAIQASWAPRIVRAKKGQQTVTLAVRQYAPVVVTPTTQDATTDSWQGPIPRYDARGKIVSAPSNDGTAKDVDSAYVFAPVSPSQGNVAAEERKKAARKAYMRELMARKRAAQRAAVSKVVSDTKSELEALIESSADGIIPLRREYGEKTGAFAPEPLTRDDIRWTAVAREDIDRTACELAIERYSRAEGEDIKQPLSATMFRNMARAVSGQYHETAGVAVSARGKRIQDAARKGKIASSYRRKVTVVQKHPALPNHRYNIGDVILLADKGYFRCCADYETGPLGTRLVNWRWEIDTAPREESTVGQTARNLAAWARMHVAYTVPRAFGGDDATLLITARPNKVHSDILPVCEDTARMSLQGSIHVSRDIVTDDAIRSQYIAECREHEMRGARQRNVLRDTVAWHSPLGTRVAIPRPYALIAGPYSRLTDEWYAQHAC